MAESEILLWGLLLLTAILLAIAFYGVKKQVFSLWSLGLIPLVSIISFIFFTVLW